MAVGDLSNLSPSTIAAGAGALHGAVSPDNLSFYVVNNSALSMSQYSRNTTTGQLTSLGTISTGANPFGVHVSPDNKNVYVGNSGATTVSQYSRNLTTGVLTSMGTVSFSSRPTNTQCTSDGLFAYVSGNGWIHQFSRDATTGALTALSPANVATGTATFWFTLSADELFGYCVNYSDATITQYSRNTTTGQLTNIGTIACGSAPKMIVASSDNKSIYVAAGGSGVINQYSRNTTTGLLTSIGTISGGSNLQLMGIAPDGYSVYSVSNGSSQIYQFSRDQTTGVLTALSPVGIATNGGGYGIAVSADNKFAYASNISGNNVNMYARVFPVTGTTYSLTAASAVTTTSVKKSDSTVTKSGTVSMTPSKTFAVASTRVIAAGTVPAILKKQSNTKTTTSTSFASAVRTLLLSILGSAAASTVSTMTRTSNLFRSLASTTSVNTSKSVLLNRAASTAPVSTMQRATTITKNIAVNSTALLTKQISKTWNTVSTAIGLRVEYIFEILALAHANTTASLQRAVSATRTYVSNVLSTLTFANTFYHTMATVSNTFASITKQAQQLKSVIVNAIGIKVENVFEILALAHANTTASLQRAVSATRTYVSSILSTLTFINAFHFTAAALSPVVSAITKQANKLEVAYSTTTASLSKLAEAFRLAVVSSSLFTSFIFVKLITLAAIATTVGKFNVLVHNSNLAVVNTISRFSEVFNSLTGYVRAVFVTIANTLFFRTAVPITITSTLVIDLSVPTTKVQIQSFERTVIRIN